MFARGGAKWASGAVVSLLSGASGAASKALAPAAGAAALASQGTPSAVVSQGGAVRLAAAYFSAAAGTPRSEARKAFGGESAAFFGTATSRGKLGPAVLAVSAAAAAGAAARTAESEEATAQVEDQKSVLSELPSEPIILYQYAVCPFCNKLRAYLDYSRIPYSVVEVNPLTKSEIKGMKKNSNGKLKVPIVGLPGSKEQMVESDDIIDAFERVKPAVKQAKSGSSWFGGRGAKKGEASAEEKTREWRTWVNERFVHILTVNIYRSVAESFQTFEYITDQGNFNALTREAARYSGAGIMYFVSKNIKKKRDLPGDERGHLYASAKDWVAALEGNRFFGGDSPSLADLSVYGVIKAIEGFDTFNDLMSETEIEPWYLRMREAVGASAEVKPTAATAA